MRITDLEIDAFGVWRGLKLEMLNEPLVVFYGPNEAGKTTLMQFMRALLYGFSPERRARYLPPVGGGRAGGALHATFQNKAISITRHADGDSLGSEVVLQEGAGGTRHHVAISSVLGGVDEAVFQHVFVLGLREIQELGTLSDTDAAHLLYDLTLGLDRVSLADVLRELAGSRNRLLATDDRPSLVVQLQSQRDRLRGEIDELRGQTSRYLELLDQRRRLEGDVKRTQTECDQAARRMQLVELARSLVDRWQRRAELDRQLAATGNVRDVPEDALAQLRRFDERVSTRQKRLAELKKQSLALRGEAAALSVNEHVCRLAARIDAAQEQATWIGALEAHVAQLEREIAELDLQRGGNTSGAVSTSGKRASPQAVATLKSMAKNVGRARREWVSAKGAMKDNQAAVATAAERKQPAAAVPPKYASEGVETALERVGKQAAQLRRRAQLEDRLTQMAREKRELEAARHEWLGKQVLPLWQAVGLGVLFVLGCGLILLSVSALVLPESMTGTIGLPVALVGIVLAAAGGLTRFLLEQYSSEQLRLAASQLENLTGQVSDTQRERDALDAQLPKSGGPWAVRLQAAEAELATLEGLLTNDTAPQHVAVESSSLREAYRVAAVGWDKARKRWREALVAAGLPEDYTPAQAAEELRDSQGSRELDHQIELRRSQLHERQREYQALSARVSQIAAEAGIKPSAAGPLALLRELHTQLQEHQARASLRGELEARRGRVRKSRQPLMAAIARLRRQRKALLRKHRVHDEAELARLIEAAGEIARLRRERDAIEHELHASLAGQGDERGVAQYLEAPAELERLALEVPAEVEAIKQRLHKLFEQRGELNQQMRLHADDRRLAHKQLELTMVERQLADALARWRVLAACDVTLEKVRSVYERDHQPQALREASEYLREMTGGRYVRVWTPLGAHVLKVDDADGQSLPVEVLSRGTREQLFLSLRLALVNAYAGRGVRLPLVLDDVLVNFDSGRARAAAGVLKRFAQAGHQLLVFTCHEHIARMFQAVDAEVRLLPDNSRPPQRLELDVRHAPAPRRVEPQPAKIEGNWLPLTEDTSPPIQVIVHPAETVASAAIVLPPHFDTAKAVLEDKQPASRPPRAQVVRKAKARPVPRRLRSDWDAEEFAGELEDRVRTGDDATEYDAA